MSTKNEYIILTEFDKLDKIGEGGFGQVFKIIHKQTGAIYTAKISFHEILIDSNEDNINLKREISILSKINHASILKFIGFSPTNFKGKLKPVIVTEYITSGSLFNILDLDRRCMPPENWNSTKKLICLYGIASGMSYLHSQRILHRDLKTMNILLDDKFYPKIADFGFSKVIHSNAESYSVQSEGGIKGTFNYMAPEIWTDYQYSTSSDVYAYAMIAYEMVTLRFPFEQMYYVDIMKKVTNNERPEIQSSIPAAYRELIERCWSQNPSDRPSFDQILESLKNDSNFITEEVDENEYKSYIRYIDEHSNEHKDNTDQLSDDTSSFNLVEPSSTGFFGLFSKKVKPINFVPRDLFDSLDKDCQQLVLSAQFDSNSQFKLGKNLIEQLNKFPRQIEIGIKYLEESISKGNLDSVSYYCEQLIKGYLIPEDFNKAKMYLNKYENRNDSRIFYLLGKLFLKQGLYVEARKFFSYSSKLGNDFAMYEYGKMLFTNHGGERNMQEGLKYITLSFRCNNKKATNFLREYKIDSKYDNLDHLPPETQLIIILLIVLPDFDALITLKYHKIEMLYENNSLETPHFYLFLRFFPRLLFEIKYPSKSFSEIFKTLAKSKQMVETSLEVRLIVENTKNLSFVFGRNDYITRVTIKSPTKCIKDFVFNNFLALKEIQFPDTLKTIGKKAFANCLSLNNIIIPSSVKKIDISSFYGCNSLENITTSNDIIQMFFNYGSQLFNRSKKLNKISFQYFRMCANQGHLQSILKYAFMLLKGLVCKANNKEAMRLYQIAAEKGEPEGMYFIGIMYEKGKGIEQDLDEAIRYYKMSIDQLKNGKTNIYCYVSMYRYGSLLIEKSNASADIEEGLKYIKTAADNGLVDAMNKYGILIEKNEGQFALRKEEAIKYFKMSMNNGNITGTLNYGRLLLKSNKLTNYKEAIKHFKFLADIGNSKGILRYCFMLENGLGTHVNHSTANKYYQAIIKEGKVECIFKFAQELEADDEYYKNIEESIRYYKLCADNGYIKAIYKYGLILYEGQYIDQNIDESTRYFEIASLKGHLKATQMLEQINRQRQNQ